MVTGATEAGLSTAMAGKKEGGPVRRTGFSAAGFFDVIDVTTEQPVSSQQATRPQNLYARKKGRNKIKWNFAKVVNLTIIDPL
jgi:hypothetical protein